MTPQSLVQTARKLSPTAWKGQQTVIRRLSRTQGLPEKTMHDALRLGVKLYLSGSLDHARAVLRPNADTPSDVGVQYLRKPHAFGLHRRDILAWTRQASNATLLKDNSSEFSSTAAAFVLFERERPEVTGLMQRLARERRSSDFPWLQDHLATMAWSAKQLAIIAPLAQSKNVNLWVDNAQLLDRYAVEVERHASGHAADMWGSWMDEKLLNIRVCNLVGPFESLAFQKSALTDVWVRFASSSKDAQDHQLYDVNRALDAWHARNPCAEDCMDLAVRFDTVAADLLACGYTSISVPWQAQASRLLPWISMMGATPQDSHRAVSMYQQFDPGLLTFQTIAQSLVPTQHPTVDNIAELLCP